MNEPKSSQSLFETAPNDVRHSVSVVDERWGREKRRRRLLMLKWCLPLFVIIVGGGLLACWKAQVFPFEPTYEEFEHQHEPPAEAQEENKPDEVMGNPEAKMVVRILQSKGSALDATWKRILTELADTKPSQVYIEFWDQAKAPKKYTEELAPIYTTILIINDEFNFDYIDYKGRKANLSGSLDSMADYDALALTAVLNQKFQAITGESKAPLDGSPYLAESMKKEEHRRKHSLPDIQSSKDKSEASRGEDGTTIMLPTLKMDVD